MKKRNIGLRATYLVVTIIILISQTYCSQQQQSQTRIEPDTTQERREMLSLDEKIGQMLLVGFQEEDGVPSTQFNAHAERLIEELHVGGILLFGRNVDEPMQIAQLTNKLQDKAKIPLFIATDQEGGKVARIQKGITTFPGNMAIGATGDPQLAALAGKGMGAELQEIGINLTLAPSVDINNNPKNPIIGVRSFGERATHTAEMADEMIAGFHESNILTAIKHFPGHGDTDVDSHIDLPQINHSLEHLMQNELIPYQKLIEQNQVDMIMSTHITFSQIEQSKKLPATLSPAILTDLLRKKMGYNGVVVTDDMEMGAIVKNFGVEEAVVKAVEAGADIILIGHSWEHQQKAVKALKQAVDSGRISEERIDLSVKRILDLKAKSLNSRSIDHQKRQIDVERVATRLPLTASQKYAQKIAENSITVVQDRQKVLPVEKDHDVTFFTMKNEQTWNTVLAASGVQNKVHLIDKNFVVPTSLKSNTVVIGTYQLDANEKITNWIQQLVKHKKRVIVLGLDTPYEQSYLPEEVTYIALYSTTKVSLEAGLRVVWGDLKAKGKLPVTLDQ
ncbi:beta-N-acetylhexosaminidase [Hazenella sp. IB182353]|uniref:beta-N-acetylhexosaminidase n=1 Tax=Polycladospora coralii TaxID=2771432 RepID=UPI0017471228|nr:beta-N-acetylhexosaminidase [Polycladospora coralii]